MFERGLKAWGIGGSLILAGFLLGSGCERSPVPVMPAKPAVTKVSPVSIPVPGPMRSPAPLVIPLREEVETVNLQTISGQSNIRIVKGDFNPDEFRDLATVQELPGQEIEITVYLGRKEGDVYSKAGQVRRTLSGKLVGFMTSRPDLYMDLVILVGHSNAPNEVIHFSNDGTRFEEVETVVSDQNP